MSDDLRRRAGGWVRTVAATAAQEAALAAADSSAVDLVVASVLARDLPPLQDASGFVGFLRDALRTDTCAVEVLRPADDPAWAAVLKGLGALPPLPLETAVRLGLVADGLLGRREPFDRPGWSGDVGLHAALSSSAARKGRLLTWLARCRRAERVVDLGTAYGMSALFLAAALPEGGHVVTVEASQPQRAVSQALLAEHEPFRVTALEALTTEAVDAVRERLGAVDLLFHDAGHSRADYVQDVAAYAPLLAPGALLLMDDIRWPGDPGTYDGWREVAALPQVRAAAEVDGAYGLLLL